MTDLKLYLDNLYLIKLGFQANELFRKIMRKLLVAVRKLFLKISPFFLKMNEANTKQKWKMRKFCEKHEFHIAATINFSKELDEFSSLIAQYFKLY